jgi:hypothetical protein
MVRLQQSQWCRTTATWDAFTTSGGAREHSGPAYSLRRTRIRIRSLEVVAHVQTPPSVRIKPLRPGQNVPRSRVAHPPCGSRELRQLLSGRSKDHVKTKAIRNLSGKFIYWSIRGQAFRPTTSTRNRTVRRKIGSDSAGVSAGGSQGSVVNSWWSASSWSRPHLGDSCYSRGSILMIVQGVLGSSSLG